MKSHNRYLDEIIEEPQLTRIMHTKKHKFIKNTVLNGRNVVEALKILEHSVKKYSRIKLWNKRITFFVIFY